MTRGNKRMPYLYQPHNMENTMKLRQEQKQDIELMLDDIEGLVEEITNPNYNRLNLQSDLALLKIMFEHIKKELIG
jgi:hypothetical protein